MFEVDENEETETVTVTVNDQEDNPDGVSNDSDRAIMADSTETIPSNNENIDYNQTEVIAALESDANTTADDFVSGNIKKVASDGKKKNKKSSMSKGKKRKAAESIDSADNEEGSVCTICFEDWSNSGDHRIASLNTSGLHIFVACFI